MYVCWHVFVYMYLYVCMYVCMYVHCMYVFLSKRYLLSINHQHEPVLFKYRNTRQYLKHLPYTTPTWWTIECLKKIIVKFKCFYL